MLPLKSRAPGDLNNGSAREVAGHQLGLDRYSHVVADDEDRAAPGTVATGEIDVTRSA